ncbi:MAG TPA: TIGR03435 family protein [Bryobacteraceae bacterium]|nr:TIGR03435 family protein [Bryobacteraceae bacterium]
MALRKGQLISAYLIAIVALAAATAFAQSPEFDVASIRPMTDENGVRTHIYNSPHNSEFRAVNVTLTALLEVAYDIPDLRMLNGPEWARTEKFDLQAKSDARLDRALAALSVEQGKEEKRRMLRALLAGRFNVRTHTEEREMPVLALRIAKGGAKLRPTDTAEVGLSGGRGRISIAGGNDALAVLAYELSWRLDRPVIDQTGLKGRYAFTLNWSEDETSSLSSAGPSLFTALEEQLGLKLEAARGPVTFLVIDHAEKPSAN